MVTSSKNARLQLDHHDPGSVAHILASGGEAGELARSVDWGQTPIGAVSGWSQALRSAAALVLHNHSGMLLWWGAEFVQIYNDAYRPVLGDKHPRAMGQRFSECWAEVFHILGPMAERPFRGGPASTSDDIAVPINRKVFREESHFRLAYSPVPDDTVPVTGIGGVLATVTEITEQAYSDRQIRTLRELGVSSTADRQTVEQACMKAAQVLRENAWDVPFALFYLVDEYGGRARLVAHAGYEEPPDGPNPWPLLRVIQGRQVEIITSLAESREALPLSPWSERPNSAIALPLAAPDQTHAYGVLICGISPHRVLDAGYRTFFDLAAAQVVAAIRNARALDEERKRAEALAEIDRAKTAFFSNVSHEFRTPLTLMLGPVEEVAANPATPAHARVQLELAHRNARRLLKLVNSLLDFSRIEAGRVDACYEPTDLAALTTDLASTFRSTIERAGLVFETACAQIGEPVYVDREMWEKIVLNLLSNAFKFTWQGSVSVRLRREASQAVLEVCDTGVGIPEHELGRLFERFHRVEGTAGRTQEGSGIGLALVQELVKINGGTVDASSELGRGTTLRVAVPLGLSHLPPERIKAQRVLSSTAVGAQPFVQEALRWISRDGEDTSTKLPRLVEVPIQNRGAAIAAGARVLLADDNSDMRSYVRDLLSSYYVVQVVSDGEQALEAARRELPDLILSDVMMPRLDGLSLLKALRADRQLREIPVILLSARAGEEARVEALDAGADDYVVKPFSARELLARVGALIELTRMRLQAEDALRSSDAQLRAIIDDSPLGVFLVDGTLRFCEVNPIARSTFGDIPDLIGKPLEEVAQIMWSQPFADEVTEKFRHTLETGEPFYVAEMAEQRRDRGATEYYEWEIHRIPLQSNRHGVVCYFRDIALQVRARTALQFADRQKDEFLAMLAHELRNPLGAIHNAGELLSRTLSQVPRAALGIGTLKRQVTQLTRLVDDLLDVSRITQGRVELKLQPLELANVISQAVEQVESLLRERRHHISISTTSIQTIYVSGDSARLVQCVGNLLTNAAKYTDLGGRVQVRTRAEDTWAIIEITDTGTGIAPELLPRVFDLFVQGERTLDRSQGGLGVGLSVVKRLIEMHSGSVAARSAGLGQGSTFEIRLPLAKRPAGVVSEVIATQPAPRRVLIVDDNVDAASSLAIVLELDHHESEAVFTAQAALRRAPGFKPDVILLDIGLPEMDGYEVARRLRAMPELDGVCLIAMTGYAQSEDRTRAREAGFDAHLAKPVDFAELAQALAGRARA
jgi:PAS domain S-box-containing protein